MNECSECVKRGKTWDGDDPTCAFVQGYFVNDNWNCATMNKLRDICKDSVIRNDDQSLGVIPVLDDYSFIVLTWYKSRGGTEGAWVVAEEKIFPLTLEVAENVIGEHMPRERKTRQDER